MVNNLPNWPSRATGIRGQGRPFFPLFHLQYAGVDLWCTANFSGSLHWRHVKKTDHRAFCYYCDHRPDCVCSFTLCKKLSPLWAYATENAPDTNILWLLHRIYVWGRLFSITCTKSGNRDSLSGSYLYCFDLCRNISVLRNAAVLHSVQFVSIHSAFLFHRNK